MKALILAGGFGTRLRRVIHDRPKSMASIAGIPFLEHQIRLLKNQGIKDFVILVSYMSNKIKSYFGDGKRLNVKITYSEEEIPLGTAGAIKNAERYIDDTFIVLNGDSYAKIDIKDLLRFHKSHNSEFTMLLKKEYENLENMGAITQGSKITGFSEKKDFPLLSNGGVYIFEPSVFEYIEREKNVSLEKEILPILARSGKLSGYVYDGYIIDIGLPETYKKFKDDILKSILIKEETSLKDAIKNMDMTGIKFAFVVNEEGKLLGAINDRDIMNFLINEGMIKESVNKVMNREHPVARISDRGEISKLFLLYNEPIPIVDDSEVLKDVEFHELKIDDISLPIVRGRAPLKLSFAGGGTDLPNFSEKYGGSVINATINKYCHATLVKRADSKIIINSDSDGEVIVDSIENLDYNGKLDLVKAILKIIKPDFGLEIYLYSDLPKSKGLGSSASIAVLIIKLLDMLVGKKYNDHQIAEIAYVAEREGLKRKGGFQDQYASIIGGFNFMEFGEGKPLVYPLRLKEEVVDELESHLILCHIGGKSYNNQTNNEKNYKIINDEKERIKRLTRLKKIAYEIRDSLLTNNLSTFGRLLNETWEIKKSIDKKATNNFVDKLYEKGIKNGAYGGRLIGSIDGGYILFFHSPKGRNLLLRSLKQAGGEILEFSFESNGLRVWESKVKF